jgi:hypothetical protein
MSKLLIYIGENEFFNADEVAVRVASIEGVADVRRGSFIGSVLECLYSFQGRTTIVRLSDELKTVSVEGLGVESFSFALNFQKLIHEVLHAIDLEYSFDVVLSNFESVDEIMAAIQD